MKRKILAALLFTTSVLLGAASADLIIGSANTAVADPPVPRPNTVPCVVQLFNNVAFNNFSPKFFTFNPPASCPGPWAKVVLTADFSVQTGRQFDRTADIFIGGVNVYFGTTSEPSANVARSWHVERDLTDYTALFNTTQNGRVDLGNLVNATFTSTLFGTAEIQFYPLAHNNGNGNGNSNGNGNGNGNSNGAPTTAEMVLPLASDPTGGTTFLNTTANSLSKTFTLPTNVERAFLDVVAQSQAGDEFWYTCVPNDVANELQSCGGTGFRESEVSIDGQAAGVAPVYPWIYTGGIDPGLWRPIPGVQTLNFVPYRVDLTPFAGVLSNGQQHTVSVNVFNANFGFSTTATLLLFQDHGGKVVTGQVTQNTIGAPSPNVVENLNTDSSGNITGTVAVTSSRQFTVAGFVNTSHGTVRTNVDQSINFSNNQNFNITALTFVQNITQRTNITSQTKTQGGGDNPRAFKQNFEWPLDLNFSFNVNSDGSGGSQTTTINQQYLSDESGHGGPGADTFRSISNTVAPTDTELFDANFNLISRINQKSAQTYFSHETTGGCFSRTITADGGVLTSVADGNGCGQ